MKKILLPLFFSLLALGNSALAAEPVAQPVEIIGSKFGVFNLESATQPFIATRLVKLQSNRSYGWFIDINTEKTQVKWREEFTLPEKPETWGTLQPDQTISEDGKTSVIERTTTPEDGLIFNMWQVAPGDPVGRHLIKVFVEGKPAGTFEFDVE